MRRKLATIIDETERSTLPWGYVVATFLAMVLARNLLEGMLGPDGVIGFVYFSSPSSLMVLDHFALFYTSLFLSFALLLSTLARVRVGAVMRVIAPAWALLLVPPIVDYIVTSGEGMKITYVLELRPVILRVFDPRVALDTISTGQRFEMLGACLLAAAYVRIKTRSWMRAALGFVGIYGLLALHGVLPSLFARTSLALSSITASPEFAYLSAFKNGGIVADESRKLALLFLMTTSILGWFVYWRHARDRARVLVVSLRPLRTLHYLGLTLFGAALGWVIFARHGVEFTGAGDVLGIVAVGLATLCAFQASVAVNDLFDEEGDRISGERRPLVEGTLTRRDLTAHAVVFASAALLFAINVKYSTFLFTLFALIVSFAYSARPLRLKRFPLVSSLTLGFISLTACLIGFSVYAGERALALLPAPLPWVIVLSFGLGFAAKDLKDVDGDEATGVRTLPVLLGPVWGRFAVAVLVLAGYLSVAVLMPYRSLTVAGLILGLASAGAVLSWRRAWLADVLLAVCLAFTGFVAFTVLSNVEPLLAGATSMQTTRAAVAAELRASTAEARSDWAAASEGFETAAAEFSGDLDVQLRAGATLFEQGRYREAMPYLANAADLDPSSPVALEYLVRAESAVGRNDSAEWLSHEAIRDGMRPGIFHVARADQHMEDGRPLAAAAHYESALALGQPDVPVRLRLAEALAAAGETIEAGHQYETVVEKRPSSAEAHDSLGRFLAAIGEAERAVEELTLAVELDETEPLYWNNLGAANRMAGRLEDSLKAIDEAVRLAPQAPEPYYNRGLTLEALGRTNEARRQYLLALEADPLHAPARAAVARVSR